MFHVRSFILYLAVIKVELQLHLYGVLKAQNFLTAGHPVQRTDLRGIFRFTLNKVLDCTHRESYRNWHNATKNGKARYRVRQTISRAVKKT